MKRKSGKQSTEIAQQTRRAILEAAGQQFAAKGFAAASLREIATAAGTTHGMIRHHYGAKENLWRAVVSDFVHRVAERHLPFLEQADEADAVKLLKTFATNYMRQSAEAPEISKLIMKDCSEPGPHLDFLVERILPVHRSITPIFERVQVAGYLSQHNPESFFIFLMMLGSFPFTLASFTNKFYHEDIRTEAGVTAHIERVLATLFEDSHFNRQPNSSQQPTS